MILRLSLRGQQSPTQQVAADALAILDKYGIKVPERLIKRLLDASDETPKPGHPVLARVHNRLITKPQKALEAAAAVARAAGITPIILSDSIEGQARDVATVHAGIARHCAAFSQPTAPPCVLISGGETTVTVRGDGRGGRNSEFLLSLAIALNGHPGIYALAADTDGIDGTEDNAGALLTPDSLARAARLGVSANASLAANDSYGFFSALGDILVTGPTRTNVNDFRAIVIEVAHN
jgi:glycerate 2-kinase